MKRLSKYEKFVDEITKPINEGFLGKMIKFGNSIANAQIFLGYLSELKFNKAKHYMSDEYSEFMFL